MNRLLAALLAALTLLSLTACGSSPQTAEPAPEPSPPAAEEPAPPPEPEPEPTPEELAAEQVETLLGSLTLEEKVGQLFFVRCPAENAVEDVHTYHLGGYILFGRDFQDSAGSWLTEEQFTQTIQQYQAAASIPRMCPVLGTTTDLTFLMMLPLTPTTTRSGRTPSRSLAREAA